MKKERSEQKEKNREMEEKRKRTHSRVIKCMDATLFYIATSSLYLRFAPRFLSI
jgi:hypothetical protein|tara:strand:+ start:157 stop:318 length:162 start_codon:yes stop_codon:yes gene_type:complete